MSEAPPTPRPPSTSEAGSPDAPAVPASPKDVESGFSSGAGKVLPCVLEASNMSYTVEIRDPNARGPPCVRPKNPRKILNGVHVKCTPGRMTALMGPSGAGKTTLLDAVAGRLTNKAAMEDSRVTVNGQSPDPAVWRKLVAYVTQEDNLIPTMSPYETLLFTANMRLPKSLSSNEKIARVNTLLQELGLSHVKDTLIGVPGVSRGLSGGERKRVNIAGQLISNPSVLFLDEPTSGLDSASAESLTSLLRSLANSRGLTLLCTIHQPSWQVFEQFDDVLLLARGSTVYYGPVESTMTHFESLGFPCPQHVNPADHILTVVSTSEATIKADTERVAKIRDAVGQVPPAKALGDNFDNLTPPTASEIEGASSIKRLGWLVKRSWQVQVRHVLLTRARVAQTVGVALLVSAVFSGLTNDQTGIQDRSGLFFLMAIQFMVLPMFSILNSFQSERPVFLREYLEGLYGSFPYYLSKVLADFPQATVLPLVFTAIVYGLVDLRDDDSKYLWGAVLPMIGMSHAGSAMGMIISAAAKDVGLAMTIAPAVFLPLMLTTGFMVNLENMPGAISWLRWVNPVKPAWSALMLNEFSGLELTCTDDQLVGPAQQCPVTNGDSVIESFSVDEDGGYWSQILFLAFVVVGARLLGAIALRLAVRGTRAA